jgi:hypothetical protein
MCAEENNAKPAEGRQSLSGSERRRPETHKLVGPADSAELVAVTLVIRRKPNSPSLPDLNYWQKTPLREQRILSVEEYTETYGAHADDLARVSTFFSARGMRVLNSHAGRRTMTVQGTVAQMNDVFGITLNLYDAPLPGSRSHRSAKASDEAQVGTQRHLGYDGPVHVPAAIAGLVTAVVGLDNRCAGGPGGSSGSPPNSNSLAVPAVAGYYNFPNLQVPDQTVGVIAPSDPPSATNPRLSGYLKNDITAFYFPNLSLSYPAYSTPPASFNDIGLTVGANSYTNSTTSAQSANNFSQEVTQDISTSTTIAQGCTLNVYFTELSENGLLVCLNRILIPETENQPTVVTCSFSFFGADSGLGSATDTSSAAYLMSEQFQQLASRGINVFLISQDEGSDAGDKDGNTHVVYPGSDPWATCCGGTVIGNVKTGPPLTFDEWVWSDAGLSNPVGGFGGASGGGASATFPIPAYQTAAGLTSITDSNGNTSSNRFVPDIAGMVSMSGFYINGSSYPDFTGTSCVAPLYAGLFAVLRSALGVELGFLNPTLYQLQKAFNDITHGNNDSNDGSNAPYYSAGPGWDACTGLGSVDGTKMLNDIAAQLYNPNYYFQVNKGSYGLDEVTVTPSYQAPLYPLWLVLEGFTPQAVTAAGLTPTVQVELAGITVSVGAPQFEIESQPNTPQRTLFPCTVTFASSVIGPVTTADGIFPVPGGAPTPVNLNSQIKIESQILAAFTQFELEAGDDPYFANFDPGGTNPFYLSQDLRVFTLTPGLSGTSIAGESNLNPSSNTSWDTTAAYSYIQGLLAHLNSSYSDPTKTDPFTLFPDQSSALSGDSSVTPTSINPANPQGTPFANYNFAVARVRLSGAEGSSGPNVRVLFRLFASETSDTDYQSSTYPSTLDAAGQPLAPLLGAGNVTIPFFATGNYEANGDYKANTDYSANSINNQPVNIPSSGNVWAYYGCYLNIYPTGNTIEVSGNKVSVQSLLPSSHSCVVAQLVYDNAPMPTGSGVVQGPEYTDNFAQRNLQITLSDNPGPAATHRVPQTFDARPSQPLGTDDLLNYPDELMIDWGNTPVGSTANIYWPQVSASDVLSLAGKIYSTHQLSAADAHTVQCKVPRGFTFVPVPPGTGENYAGLFTVDLPQGVKAGQEFTIVVRRVSTRRGDVVQPPPPPPQPKLAAAAVNDPGQKNANWRFIVGTFAVRIPVTTPKVMLPPENNTLAIMKWRLAQMSPTNRWVPVLKRYIGYIEGRVNGLGGNSSTIKPSPWGSYGAPPVVSGRPPRREVEFTGKIAGLIYDHFGDFEGFILETATCQTHRFCSREAKIERLVRDLWHDRSIVTVVVKDKDSCCIVAVIAGDTRSCCENR